jgi:hypothetical protein
VHLPDSTGRRAWLLDLKRCMILWLDRMISSAVIRLRWKRLVRHGSELDTNLGHLGRQALAGPQVNGTSCAPVVTYNNAAYVP